MKIQWITRLLSCSLMIISIPIIFLGSEISANANHHQESDPNNQIITNRNSRTETQREKLLLQVNEVNLLDSIDSVPGNDDRENATEVNSFPFTDWVDTTFATIEEGEVFDCGVDVGKSVWYEYTPEANVDFVIDTFGSDFDTVIEYYEKVNIGDEWFYLYIDCNDDFNGQQSQLSISGIIGRTYLIAIGGNYQASGSMSFNLNPPTQNRDVTCGDITVIPQAECLVLEDFFNQTGGITWYNSTGWFVNNEVCTWHGIVCNGDHIEQINLGLNNLTGDLTTDFSSLSQLSWFQVSKNYLTGDLDVLLNNLPHSLSILMLNENNFTGMITSSISDLSNLSILGLNGNQITGDLSTTVGYLSTNLSYLDLGINYLVGDLSTIINNLPTNLSDLYLHGNNFTGMIPDTISTFSYLNYFSVADNPALAGTIPLSIIELNYVYMFDFSNTNLCEPNDPAYNVWKASISDYYPGQCGTNILTNTSFETYIPVSWQDGWEIDPTDGPDCGTEHARTGNCAMHFEGNGTNKRILMRFKLTGTAEDNFSLTIYRKGLNVPSQGVSIVRAILFYLDGTREVFNVNLNTGNVNLWEQLNLPFSAAKDYKQVNLLVFYTKASGTMWLDDIRLNRNGGAELLENTSFETWKPDDYLLAENFTPDDGPVCTPAEVYSRNCSLRFVGDGTSKRLLMRVRHAGNAGDVLTFSVMRKGVALPIGASYVNVILVNVDGTLSHNILWLHQGDWSTWNERTFDITTAKDYKWINVNIFYKKPTGTIWLDDISLLVP